MRCRRLSARYAMFIARSKSRFLSENWALEKVRALAHSQWHPATDIYETDSMIYVTAELAGLKPEEIDIALYEDALIIEGKRQFLIDGEDGVYHLAEIRQGPFRLELILPALVDQEQVDARYEQGLLSIILVKREDTPYDR